MHTPAAEKRIKLLRRELDAPAISYYIAVRIPAAEKRSKLRGENWMPLRSHTK